MTSAQIEFYAEVTLPSDPKLRANHRVFGPHEAWTESDDIVFAVWRGNVYAKDIEVVAGLIQLLPTTDKNLTLIQDVSAMDQFTSEARAKIIEDKGSRRLSVVILAGAKFQVRMVMLMVNRAMRLLHNDIALMLFCSTLEEARTLYEQRRQKM